ncbi:MAG: hypothetical protein HQK89_00125 [Nitrospirae bacterium]|nr:hypothetical protein [Nitrospirota bacterium]
MILHPGALALITGAVLCFSMTAYAVVLALKIIWHWDISSSSELQLALERRTYLISTVMNYVMGFEILSLFLYVYTLDSIHVLFVGAMCATGSLNANPIGWYVLYTRIAIFFLSATWIAINYLDGQAEDYPLVKLKYKFLLFIAPMIFLDGYLEIKYFAGLKPDVITSCCGSLFSDESKKVAGSLAGLPIKPMMYVFYCAAATLAALSALSMKVKASIVKYLTSFASILFFPIAIASTISFISIYYYELPTHHCPFDILQGTYNYVGYPLFVSLFGGSFFPVASGVAELFGSVPSLREPVGKAQKRWYVVSIILIAIFVGFSSWPIVFSGFTPF